MADIELNKLGIKSDSLPNDWYVSLISPKAGQPAEIMTVARFKELLPFLLESGGTLTGNVKLGNAERVELLGNISVIQFVHPRGKGQFFNSISWVDAEREHRLLAIGVLTVSDGEDYTSKSFRIGWGDTPWDTANSFVVDENGVWYKGKSLLTSTNAVSANALTETIVEEVPILANTARTLQEDGPQSPTMQTVEHYEYSIPKMAEAILELRKELDELKA